MRGGARDAERGVAAGVVGVDEGRAVSASVLLGGVHCWGAGRMMRDPVIEEYSRLALQYDRRWSFYVAASTRETMAQFFGIDLVPDWHRSLGSNKNRLKLG